MGVVLACPPCFLGFGVLLVSCFFLPSCGFVVGGWGVGLSGGFLGFGVGCAWFFSFFLLGVGWVRLARPVPAFLCGGWVRVRAWFLLPSGGGGWVRVSGSFLGCGFRGWVGRPGSCVLCGGWVCLVSCFVFAVVFGRVRGGVSGCFCFRSALPYLWFGGCRVGLGLLFSPAVLLGPGLFRVRVLVLFGEFDPGSGRTLAACLTHASRTGPLLFLGAG